MNNKKPLVFLPGASGSMGYETFKLLWQKRDRYDIVLLQRPSKTNKKLFRSYEIETGAVPIKGAGITEGKGLKIVWGDATDRDDIFTACQGIDWCLCCMALISPEADRRPDDARKVNTLAIQYIVEAIEAQDPENIRMVYIGTIAEYGDRLPPLHMARTGDPLMPSVYDMYSNSKIKGELAVMESKIKHWVSLRQTFIMIPDLFSLMDPILYHQPINSFMENITVRDAGRFMVKCLDIQNDSEFWRRCFNVSGGPGCRTTFIEFLDRIYSMLGLDYRRVMNRKFFALKNFHMQYFEDADLSNKYLHHWEGGKSMNDYYDEVWEAFPWYMKLVAWMDKYIPPVRWIVEVATRLQLRRLAFHDGDGSMQWIKTNDTGKIKAFFGSLEAFNSIPDWDVDMPSINHDLAYNRLEHGYDENKSRLTYEDLRKAASFRGGQLLSPEWNGEMFEKLEWICCQGHNFKLTPNSVLKAGHWCVDCISSPWNYDFIAGKSPYFSQAWRG